MRRLWIWDNGDYCVLEEGLIPYDTHGKFVDDDIQKGKLWMELVDNQEPAKRRFILGTDDYSCKR